MSEVNIKIRVTGEDAVKIVSILSGTDIADNLTVTPVDTMVERTVTTQSSLTNQTVSEGEPSPVGAFDTDRARARWDRSEEALLARYLMDGKDVSEVAKMLGRTEAAVRVRMSKRGLTFQVKRADLTDAVLTLSGDVTKISIKDPNLQHFVYAFVEAHREEYDTMAQCLEEAAIKAGCSVNTIKRIHYKK
jgi:hypothetical protein